MQKKHNKTSFLRIWVSNWHASKELLHSKTVSNRHKTNFTLKQSLILLLWTSSVIGLFLKISNYPIRFYSMGQGFITQIFWNSMVQSHSSLVAICFKMSNAFSDAEGHATGRNYMNKGMFCCGRIYNLVTWSYKVSEICEDKFVWCRIRWAKDGEQPAQQSIELWVLDGVHMMNLCKFLILRL
jgi:hypothetical protein